MADPVLVSNVAPYTGFTLDEITERLLGTRGMTLDALTGRTLATTSEQTDAYNRVRRAFTLLNTRWPNLWSIQTFKVNWTPDDTRIALPASIASIVYVNYNGVPMLPLTRTKYQALSANVDTTKRFRIDGLPGYYFIPGFSDEGVPPATDYRLVLELVPHPGTQGNDNELEIAYNSKAPALPRADTDEGAVTLPVHESLQEWALRRAQELWAADQGDAVTGGIAKEERAIVELDIDEWIEANNEYPMVVEAEYPILPTIHRNDSMRTGTERRNRF